MAVKLVAGLWNPGSRYVGTRHNVGGAVVESVASGAPFKKARLGIRADVADVRLGGTRAVLALPRTFMNECGQSIAPLVRYEHVALDDLLVVHDDIDLPFGKIRVRFGGGAGGHNGVRSIVGSLGTPDFWRLKIGVGRPPGRIDPADFVLSRFTKAEEDGVTDMMIRAAQIVDRFAADDGEAARQQAGERND